MGCLLEVAALFRLGALHRGLQPVPDKLRQGFQVGGLGVEQDLAGAVAGQPVGDDVDHGLPVGGGDLVGHQLPGGHVRKAQPGAVPLVVQGADKIVPGLVQHGIFQHRARGDDPDHVPLDNTLGQLGVL